MSATYNNAILGKALRVGVIPSSDLTPNFVLPNAIVPMDGGLITDNVNSTINVQTVSNNAWWIGPNGTTLNLSGDYNFYRFAYDGYANLKGGCWYDEVYSRWYACAKPELNGHISSFSIIDNKFYYSRFNLPLFMASLVSSGYFSYNINSQSSGFSRNFVYGGIDQLIVPYLYATWDGYNTATPMEFSLPYGISDIDFSGSPFSPGVGLPNAPVLGNQLMLYRPGKGKPLSISNTGENNVFNFATSSGIYNSGAWHVTSTQSGVSSYFIGRLFNGFVYVNVFTEYSGCVYTEDFITFYPIIDITGLIDFSDYTIFGLKNAVGNGNANYFMVGFGYSYLANYFNATSGFSKAAYKIYPAFNFTPMVPDSFFIPSVCGCNRRSNRA